MDKTAFKFSENCFLNMYSKKNGNIGCCGSSFWPLFFHLKGSPIRLDLNKVNKLFLCYHYFFC